MTVRQHSRKRRDDIAIIGMAVNLPGAASLDDFWRNLADGVESISRLDPAALIAAGEPPELVRREGYVPAAGLLDGYDMFDAGFFGLSPREAAILDPQHRKFLETAWEALENAGHTADDFAGRVGVFAGCGAGTYLHRNLLTNPDLVEELGPFQLRNTGNDKDFLAARVSHALGLTGPSLTIQTACSSALVGLHQAARALADGDCDLALVGGVSIEIPQGRGYLYRDNDILSPDGHCRAFDHRAGGTVMGSGAGVVVLRRLDDALADGDYIWAVVKGSAVNNDGADKAGFFAPSEAGQAEVVGRALDAAGVDPATIAYVECHGTGTLLGDPFEVAGLTRAWRDRGAEGVQLAGIGSVQTNVGNLDTAAAVTGLVKTALSLSHGAIPPSLNFEAPNPMIDFASSPFYVNDTLASWPEGAVPRRAAVNSLGVGGTNAHAILEQAPARGASDPGLFPFQPIFLSARSRAALDEMAASLAAHLRAHPEQPLADVAFTLFEGRRRFEHSRVLVAASHAEAAELLAAGKKGQAGETGEVTDGPRVFTHERLAGTPEVVFAFPGAVATAPGALGDLYETEPVFHDWMARGLDALAAACGETGEAIRALVLDAGADLSAGPLAAPGFAEPLGVVAGVAMAELGRAWGIAPVALTGTDAGELAGAVVAGIIGFEDAVRLARLKGLREEAAGTEARAAARAALRDFAATLDLSPPEIPLVSARTGAPLTAEQATSFETWVSTGSDGAALQAALGTLGAGRDRVFLLLAADADLAAALTATAGLTPNRVIAALPEPQAPVPGDVHFITALARLRALGAEADWQQFWAGAKRHRVPLPGYRFQRERYLIEPGEAARADTGPEAPSAALLRQDEIRDWGWRPVWYPAHAACEHDVAGGLEGAPKETWLVFEDGDGIAAPAFARLEAAGHTVVRVVPGDSFAEIGTRRYSLLSEQGREGYDALFAALAEAGLMPTRIAHFWGALGAEAHRLGSDPFHDNLEYGFFSLTYLAQALGRADLAGPVHVIAVTRGAASVRGEAMAHPEKATIAGPAGAMARELPGVTCTTIDLDPQADAPARRGLFARRAKVADAGFTARLLEDLLAAPANETVAYRGDRRYRQSYTRVALDRVEASPLRDGGTWLITGGLGDIGLDIARGLAERHGGTLILVARRALPPRAAWERVLDRSAPGDRTAAAIRGVRALEALGATVEVAHADVTNLEAMRAVVTDATARHGRIDAVFHAAGVLDDGPLMACDPQGIERVFAPKIDGLRVLDELFPDGATDLMVLFSSTSTATRAAGELDFIAANAYLDAYARSRQGGAARVVSLGWAPWSGIGMIARALDPVDPSEAPFAPVEAPLLDSAGFDRDGARVFHTTWEGPRAWVLDQHRTAAGAGLMPVSAIAELAAEGFLADGGAFPFEIRNLRLARRFVAAERASRSLLRVTFNGAAADIEVLAEAEVDGRMGRVPHARARVAPLDIASPPPVNLGAVATRCHRGGLAAAAPGARLSVPKDARLVLGPAWQALCETALSDTEGLARLDLPDAARDTQAPGVVLHPGLFDLAMGWAVSLAPGYTPDTLWLPESIGSVRVHAALPGEIASWVRLVEDGGARDTARFEVTLCDLDGRVLVEIGNLRMRRVPPEDALAPAPLGVSDVIFPGNSPGNSPGGPAPRHRRSASEALVAWASRQGIRSGEGIEALERALAVDLPQVLVSPLDLDALMAAAARSEPAASAASAGGQGFDRPALATAHAAPETEVEAALAAEWSKLLGIREIGIDDDFFDLGGHSLIAVRLCANVNKAFGTDFGLAVLAEAPTIREWARRIEVASAPGDTEAGGGGAAKGAGRPAFTHIVPLNRSKQTHATPVFLVAGMFGNVLNLRHVAQILGEDRPVYGLQAKGLLGDDEPFHRFAEAAASKLAEIRRIQPRGPYVVGGFSGGGITALEIARLIEAEGDEVALVVMFDTYKDHDPVLKRVDKALIKLAEFRRKGVSYIFEWPRDRVAWEIRKRRQGDEPASEGTFHDHKIEMAFRDAIAAYEPGRYDMNVVLLRPALDKYYKVSRGQWITREKRYVSEDNQWGEHIPRLEVVEVPGDHGSMVLVPNVGVVGTYLRARIDAALASPGETVQWGTREAAE